MSRDVGTATGQELYSGPPARRRRRDGRSGISSWWLAAGIPALLLVLVWSVGLEDRLPRIRVPVDGTDRQSAEGLQTVYPGQHTVRDIPVQTAGEWIEQPLETGVSLATESPSSTMSLRFYGTSIALVARVGPESGRVYVQIDGRPVPHLSSDERGTYLSLRATKARDEILPIASGLSHREHTITLTNGPEGDLAVSGFRIEAQTPFPWAFALLDTLAALLLLVILRALAVRTAQWFGWWPESMAAAGREDRGA